ncbi:hypothetical protein SEA_LIBERTYBELL_63 [Streptomyces phage LibertyBell]|nr:hypothetical protein SEA_LIBERTYBELL_63 [Streptomyces phage LibertyBell]
MSNLSTYVNKTEYVTAVRLDEHNIHEISEMIDGHIIDDRVAKEMGMMIKSPHIVIEENEAHLGDWVVLGNGEKIEFYTDAEFLGKYHSLSEALSESDRLVQVHKIISDAMIAGRHGNPSDTAWETVAMLAAKHVLSIV